jgi:signal transduction histidine kinase
VRVVDTGLGIAPADLARVFERFYRVEAQSNIPGTGLGLSIARELIELHGGHIAAASTPGQGSIFAVFLPLVEEA